MITAQRFTFYIIKCESLSGDLFHINSILIDYFVTNELRSVSKCELIVDSLEQKRTMVIVWLQAGQELSARIKVDCLTVAWYLINRNLSMIGK